jgi:hypothetical protein
MNGVNKMLTNRERKILVHLAEVLLSQEHPTKEYIKNTFLLRIEQFLRCASKPVRFLFRAFLHIFDAAIFVFLVYGKYERFCHISPRAKRRYVRAWMHSKIGFVRNLFLLVKLIVVAPFFGQESIWRSIGFEPDWSKEK